MNYGPVAVVAVLVGLVVVAVFVGAAIVMACRDLFDMGRDRRRRRRRRDRVLSILALAAMLLAPSAFALDFPSSAITNQDKIDWLTAELDGAERAIEAETAKPRPQQIEASYHAAIVKSVDVVALSRTLAGGLPSIEARGAKVVEKAASGLDRLLNSKLKIGMPAEQVRQIRGRPKQIAEVTTAAGVREQWDYGGTALLFDNGKLVEIRQIVKSDATPTSTPADAASTPRSPRCAPPSQCL
jgi:hypothetical protein